MINTALVGTNMLSSFTAEYIAHALYQQTFEGFQTIAVINYERGNYSHLVNNIDVISVIIWYEEIY